MDNEERRTRDKVFILGDILAGVLSCPVAILYPTTAVFQVPGCSIIPH